MIRIAHISDLHVLRPGGASEEVSLAQKVAARLQKAFDVRVELAGHSEEKLEALRTSLRSLKPDFIAVTGDLSTLGDRPSLEKAAEILKDLQTISGARRILCVPGNHDSFGERFRALRRRNWWLASLFKVLQFLNRDIDTAMRRGADMALLKGYAETISQQFGAPDPGLPTEVSTDLGSLLFFCMDSTNDPGLMANEGRVGPRQYNRLRSYLDHPDHQAKLRSSLCVALLHHHPLPIPYQRDTALEHFYNSMRDGSTLCYFLNTKNFHFVLHGHEHQPYSCSVKYSQFATQNLNIVAAGTALQTSQQLSEKDSFNVLDILTPLQARLRLFKYQQTGFEPAESAVSLDVVPASRFRISAPGDPETPGDTALRNLLRVNPEGIDEDHECEEISLDVEVLKDQTYVGTYRLRGLCRSGDPTEGISRVLTGSPAMDWPGLELEATDNLTSKKLAIQRVRDFPNQKVFKLLHLTSKASGTRFDITYTFRWCGSPAEPNDFDGFNLMYFKFPVGRFKYAATLPWMPAAPRVWTCGLSKEPAQVIDEKLKEVESGRWRYSFELEKPKSLAILISLPIQENSGPLK